MNETTVCPGCHRKLTLPEEHIGSMVECPNCKGQFLAKPHFQSSSPAGPVSAEPFAPPKNPHLPRRARPSDWPGEGIPHALPAPRKKPARKVSGVGASLMIAGGIALLFCCFIGGLTWLSQPRHEHVWHEPNINPEDAEAARRQQIAVAFRQQQPMTAQEIELAVTPLFQQMRLDIQDQGNEALVNYFDTDRLYDEMLAHEVLVNKTGRVANTQNLHRELPRHTPPLRWDEHEIKQVKKLNGNEAELIVRHKSSDGQLFFRRWWVSQRTGGWKIYDVEDLWAGLRVSATLGFIAPLDDQANAINRAMIAVREAHQDLNSRMPDLAAAQMRRADDVVLSPKLQALRLIAQARIADWQLRHEAAERLLEEARALQPDVFLLELLQASVCINRKQPEQALKHLHIDRSRRGEDALMCYEFGEATRELRRFPESIEWYRKSLDYNPKFVDSLIGLLRALGPNDQRDDLAERFSRLDDPAKHYASLAKERLEQRDGKSLESLAQAMLKRDPNHRDAHFHLAVAKAYNGQPDQAAALFQDLVKGVENPFALEKHVQGYMQAMVVAGLPKQALDAFGLAPDAGPAFRSLATELKKSYYPDELGLLVRRYAKIAPADPLLALFQADQQAVQGNFASADKAFIAALANPFDQATVDLFRTTRVQARFHSGQGLSALREIGPKKQTFPQLANLCVQHRDDILLKKLVDAFAEDYPRDPEVTRHRFGLLCRADQVKEAAKLLKSSLDDVGDVQERQRLTTTFLYAAVDAGKAAEAYEFAPTPATAFEQLATDLQSQSRPADLRRLVEAHRRKQPDDYLLLLYEGTFLLFDGEWARAAAVLEKGLGKAEHLHKTRFRFALAEASCLAGSYLQAYAKADEPRLMFNALASHLTATGKTADLLALVAAHRQKAADDPSLLYFEARAKILEKQPDQALALFDKLIQQTPRHPQWGQQVSELGRALGGAGRAVEAYQRDPNRQGAFYNLAFDLLELKNAAELEKLLKEHAQTNPADVNLARFRAEACLLRGDTVAAEKHLPTVAPSALLQDRDVFYRIKVRLGKVVETYAKLGASTRVFQDLAFQCIMEKDAEQLEHLLTAHRKATQDDSISKAYEVDILWLKKDYQGVLKWLEDNPLTGQHPVEFQWKFDHHRVCSLCKLKKFAEAVAAAKAAVDIRRASQVILVLAHAEQGDAAKTIAVLQGLMPTNYLIADCYRDHDLGPILRSESFQAFRERFPLQATTNFHFDD